MKSKKRTFWLGTIICINLSLAMPVDAQTVVSSATMEELRSSPLPRPQETIRTPKLLTLQEAIVLALRNNPAVHSSRFQRISDKWALELANYAFQPQFNFTGNVTFTQGEKKTGYNFNPGVTLNTPWGTQVAIQNTTDFEGRQQEQATVTQPLWRGFGIVNKIPWLNAQDNELVARETFKNNTIEMVSQVITHYRQVVQDYNSVKVQEKALSREEETSQQYQLRVSSGKMAPSELTQEQATLATTRLETVRQKNATEQDYQTLLDTLGLAPESKLRLDENINFKNYLAPSQSQAIEIALANNPAYVSQKIQLNAAKRAVIVAKDALRWQINLIGAATFLNSSGGLPSITSLSQVSNTNKPTAQIEIAIPIRDITSKAAVVDAQVTLSQAEDALEQSRRSLIRQVMNSLTDLNSQAAQLTLAEEAVILQRKNFETEQIKQRYGQTTALNVNIIQDNLLRQEIDFVIAQIGYLNSVTAFQNLLGITLREWNIEMRY